MISKLATQLARRKVDKIPAGWFTRDQLARREGASASQGYFFYLVRRAVKEGLLEERHFRVLKGNGARMQPHYRYTKKARAETA